MPITHEFNYTQPRGNVGHDPSNMSRHPSPSTSQKPASPSRQRPQTPPNPQDTNTTTASGPAHMYSSPIGLANNCGESRADIIARVKKEQQRASLLHNTFNRSVSPTATVTSTTAENGHYSHHRSLLPAFQESQAPHDNTSSTTSLFSSNLESGSLIERPRSALHTGDFRSQDSSARQSPDSPRPFSFLENRHLQASDAHVPSFNPFAPSLHPPSPPPHPHLLSSKSDLTRPPRLRSISTAFAPRETQNRAVSQSSLSGSLIYRPPTSPLAQQSNSYDEDFDTLSRQRSRSPDKSARRHTFSPRSFQTFQSNNNADAGKFLTIDSMASPSMRREASHPCRTHQPRRSLGSFSAMQPLSTIPSPYPRRSRQPSLTSDCSPLQHAPMVGGYEESILRGRMSTLPSRPLNFLAEIGVLGKGNCKASLRCPPHVLIPFPAVFYNYGNPKETSRSSEASGPSPYVGLVDIENSLNTTAKSSMHRLPRSPSPCSDMEGHTGDSGRANGVEPAGHKAHRHRRSRGKGISALKKPPKGSYRIPQQGQLQIVIKNPNKTAVKLFLIPYDLSGMEPGQKTFVRQRSYSAGPIIDMPLSSRRNYGTDRPEAAISHSEDPNDRPVLRYLIHVHMCCPSRGRFYLYKSVRVVFANRVPDGKEKLRNEIQLPEPRFSLYKPDSESSGSGSANATSIIKSIPASPWIGLPGHAESAAQVATPMHWPPSYHHAAQQGQLSTSPVGIGMSNGSAAWSLPNKASFQRSSSANYTWNSPAADAAVALAQTEDGVLPDGSNDFPISPRSSSVASGCNSPAARDGSGSIVPRQLQFSFAKIDTSRPGTGRSDSSMSSGQGLLALQFQDLHRGDLT